MQARVLHQVLCGALQHLISRCSTAGTAVVTWDATDVYVGTRLVDVRTGGNQHWFVVYFGNGDNTGSTQTVQYNTQLQTLPFRADYALAWKANDSFSRLSTWNGSTWVTTDTSTYLQGTVLNRWAGATISSGA